MPTNKLEIYRGESLHLTVDIDERTQFSHTLNAEHKITAVFVSPTRLDLQTEDYIIHNGERYSMNLPPSYRKSAKITFLYTCEFEHIFYKTHNKLFMHLGSADFSYFGDATAHMQLVINNLNEIAPSGWSLGAMASTEPKLITYVNNEQGFSCRNAIAIIAETFELEIYYDGQRIGLVERVGVNTNISFEYGRGDGMYALSRLTPDNYLPANKIYVFGGKTNIPFDYRGGTKRLVFADRFVTRPLEPGEPVIEGVRFYDDIFPERTSSFETVTGDGLLLTDSTIDFDINDEIIAGVPAYVVFMSGHLRGNQFEIESYDHATKTIKILPFIDENGYTLPNDVVQPENGDSYTLTGISLPQSYVDAAEIRLKQRGDDDISQPERLPYEIEIDEKFMRDNGLSLNVGDRVLIKDDDLGVDDTIRMSSIQYPLVNPDKITAEISDKVLYTKVDRVIQDQKRENDVIIRKQTQDYEATRRNMLRFKQLNDLVFDPDGYFDPERIKPFSIETYLLSVGAQSQNFGLNGVTISTNHLGNPNTMVISSGELVHYTLEIEGLGYIWTLPQSTFSSLDPAKSYYVYAHCSRTVLTGEWMISENPVMAEDPIYPGMWNFNLGILFDVKEGRRDFEFTKGMTFIVGDTIKTGRVQSHSGNSYLDLDTGQFKIGTTSSGLDWDVTRPGTLSLIGSIAQSRSGAYEYVGVDRGNYSPSTNYFRGDIVRYEGSWYKYINEGVENVSGIPPTNATYWRLTSQKGDPGPAGANGSPGQRGPSPTYQGVYSPSTTYYGTSDRVDIVQYLGVYYMADPSAGAFSGQLPTNPAYWTYFGASFESVATALLFAEMAVIENATVRYLETAPSGKRTIINNPRVLRSSGVTQYENNIKIVNASNQDLLEIDDDSAQAQELFTITFSSNVPAANVRNWDQNWSAYNGSFLSTTYAGGGSPLWASGNFTDGFPRKFTNVINQVGGNYVYYFFYEEQGLIVHGNNAEGIFPKTTFGKNVAYMRNAFVNGSIGTGFSRYGNGGNIDTDFNSDDADIIVPNNLIGLSITLPAWVISGVVQQDNLSRSPFGREIRIINESSVNPLTIDSQSGNIIRRHGADVSSFALLANKTAIIKVTATVSPIQVGSFRWQVIGIMDN